MKLLTPIPLEKISIGTIGYVEVFDKDQRSFGMILVKVISMRPHIERIEVIPVAGYSTCVWIYPKNLLEERS